MLISQTIENTMYFVALINPVSKVLFLASKNPPYTNKELFILTTKASTVSLAIFLILTSIGDFLLTRIFHVEMYSLNVAGGVILFIVGLTAVRKGKFFEENKETQRLSDISIVPLATPLITGPATMTAAMTFASIHGIGLTDICITLAILINLILMLLSRPINNFLEKLNITGPIIRITGLIVTAVATQMVFSGCATWARQVF